MFNIVHIPILIATIIAIRKCISNPLFMNKSFLWAKSPVVPDPYYILPGLACFFYYINFGKNITPFNEDTFIV